MIGGVRFLLKRANKYLKMLENCKGGQHKMKAKFLTENVEICVSASCCKDYESNGSWIDFWTKINT